jgi:hypothetical protein
MLTQLIFEHALRIRLRADTGSNKGNVALEGHKANPKSGNILVGRINTLIGSDIDAVERGRDFLLPCV